nr:tetratricopeptide repeat protein [uncultured Psychroserpens sp.]
MKKATLLFFLFFSFVLNVQAQEKKQKKEEVMATIICECLDNEDSDKPSKNFEEKFEECYNASVLGALISQIPTDKDATITLNSDGSSDMVSEEDKKKAFKILENDCEVFKNYINQKQSYNEYLGKSANLACDCIDGIPTDIALEEKNKLISECITKGVSGSKSRDHINLNTVEEIKAFYTDIQRVLVNECKALKIATFSNDEEKLNSYSSKEKANEFYNKGIDESKKGNYKKAIKFYKKAVALDDKFVFAWDNLGRSYRELHDYDKAIVAYKNSIAVDSLNKTSLMNIAVAYNYKKDLESSEYWYNRLKDAYPEDPEGHYGLALVYMNRNKLEASLNSAIDAYELYRESKSPYAADAQKVMQYLYALFEEQNKTDNFEAICKERGVKLN